MSDGEAVPRYRDGVVSCKATSTKLHSLIQFALPMLLRGQGVQPLPELNLVPDACVAGEFPGPYPTEPALLCCEILSPEDRLGTMLGKCEEYHAWGVPYCWVIDPVKRTAWEYNATSEPVRVSETLRAGELSVSLEELFSSLPTAS